MAAEQPIPVYTNLTDLYANLGTSLNHSVRWNNLAEEFEKRFGRKPAYIARAPGRVNLIGEHIDYALFGVLPAAIERDILIACGPRPVPPVQPAVEVHHSPGSVIAENLHAKYTRQIFTPAQKALTKVSEDEVHVEGWHLDINTKELRWESYVKAGYYGVLNHYFSSSTGSAPSAHPVPVDLLVTGSVPAGSGLSSSAAMVVASTLAFLAVNGKLDDRPSDVDSVQPKRRLNKGELVKMAVENEKRVGVNSGGMDQAASVISNADSALYITFYPILKAIPIKLPPHSVFVCANSLVVADKVLSAKTGYNLRVVETLVGARVLANSLGIEVGPKERITLREVIGRLAGEAKGEEMNITDLRKVLERTEREVEVLKPRGLADNDAELGVTMEQMIEMSGLTGEVFREVYLSLFDVEATHFQLYKRAKHVCAEALRVLQFQEACLSSADISSGGATAGLENLGRLMNESQTSCADLFECSCPELNELTRLARQAGAFGSRLTGAGWGGCTVSLVAEDAVDSFIEKIRDTYPPYHGLKGEALAEVIFATRPSSGACVYKFD